ncbi:MAG: efflux RND transporter permease subunit [Gammaproteobacteria bacterium]|nr:MAG: efflux RND transporter permease subunit [Gammaproteobacteria bacterium]
MNLTRLALSNPVAAVVAVLLVLLFGTIALLQIPVQMIPTVVIPRITITTPWRAAAPEEVESEIIEAQEDALRGVPGVDKLVSSAAQGQATISLTFDPGVPVERALIEVINGLNQVQRYPVDAGEPRIETGSSDVDNTIAWFGMSTTEGNDNDIAGYEDFVDEVVQTRLERINGIARTIIYGARASEIRVTFDPYKAAALGIDIPTLAALTGDNTDTTGGFSDVGRRQYTVRFAGRYEIEDFGDLVLTWRDGNPVRLRDLASVESRLVDPTFMIVESGAPALAIGVLAEEGINVLDVMDDLKAAVAELRAGPLAREGLSITQLYDVTEYIKQSIGMLALNLVLGIVLGVGVLWWFLRRWRATVVVAIAIPVSLFASFLALSLGGRTLNVISLAALAFAMGMVLDASIIVLENIVRLREKGESSEAASQKGPDQVWGALFASTATTVAIFLPILFLQDFAGQLFADLAFAISVAIVASLLIAMGLVPAAAHSWLHHVNLDDPHEAWWDGITRTVMRATDTRQRRHAWIAGLVLAAVTITWVLKPPADYLPEGNQNFVFAFILPPPGLSIEAAETEFLDVVKERLAPYLAGRREPQIEMYFLGIAAQFGIMGVRIADVSQMNNLLRRLNSEILAGIPDTLAFANRVSIFSGFEGGRDIEVNIQSRDIDAILASARLGMVLIPDVLPGSQVRPDPGDQLAQPELRLIPNERRIAEVGWNRSTMSRIVRALVDGLFVGEYFDGVKKRDIVLRGPEWESPEELAATPLATPMRGTVPLGELVRVERTVGPNQIRRVDRRRTITLVVTPPPGLSLEESIATLREEVEPALLAELPEDGEISYYGSADNLQVALSNMARSFTLAITILYLLISALFRSFKDSLLVLLVLPLATVGGVIGLRLTNLFTFQPMDLLTMIGFITLLGLVVNNAILLVHQTRSLEREGIDRREAVQQAVRIRLRPILMSTLTSLFAVLPLLLIPGSGTELYRGMAAVIVGGMSVSAVFTLILLPSLLRLGEEHPGEAVTGVLSESYAGSRIEG